MPESNNCCEAQGLDAITAKSHMDESIKPTEPSLIQQVIDNPTGDGITDTNLRVPEGCPRIDPCPAKAAIQTECETEKGDGDNIALERARNAPPGPLGPVPTGHGENVPLEYWTPLGDLTGTRPAVENFSLSRFSPNEWNEHNKKLSAACHDGIQVATTAGFNALCSISRAYAEADRNQMDNNIRLSTRAGTIHRWTVELERMIADIVEEIDLVQEVRRRTMRGKSVLQVVENIGKDMMRIRCFRMDNDLVRDQVSEEVTKELSLCEEIRDVYIRLLDQIKMQIEELITAKRRVEFDWSEKKEAYEIETESRGLGSQSDTILWKAGSTRIPPDQSSPSGYEYSTKQVLAEGYTAKQRSSTLRVNVDAMIEKAVKDLRDQADRVDLTLTQQIQLQEQALRRLEAELYKDLQQLSDTETLIDEMHDASKKLDGAMKCAQTRLDKRLLRHGVENCRDVPQFGLIEEVKSLSESVSATLGQLKRAENSTSSLIQSRRDIEKEMVVKPENT
ncbi:tektin-4-like [Neodiprion pinetum]|uniref:tektin-4-like n=1 Tax=Neodiprion pinetum TaxID=441929 RepID=UPI00371A864F